MNRRLLAGIVVSDKCDKTVTVCVERRIKHPLYGKIVRKFKKYMAHDPSNRCQVGELVEIFQSRPHSRRKHWEVFLKDSQVGDKP